ncbi:MAG: Fur family transcriptional regulator [Gemmatimonadota bacterium]|nr:Fur family transcriptional regulator [Gemmatimonadota bacterium]
MADADVGDRFRAFLRERNLPITSQRLVIADLLLNAPGHLSAEDVTAQLGEKGHKFGLATVYRTLDLLVASGLVVERDFGEGFRRYEPAREVPHHYHLTCTVCGSVTEFFDERVEDIIRISARARGFVPAKHRLLVQGTCRTCRGAPHGSTRSVS